MKISCDCSNCKGCCIEVPGWFTPAEALLAIEAGFANRLSAVKEDGVIAIAPSPVGYEGQEKRHGPGICNFFTKDGLCEIHDSGFKPIECRTGFGCSPGSDYPELETMHEMWVSEEGQNAVKIWRKANATS
jgi:Fe-S-cluster containining protein